MSDAPKTAVTSGLKPDDLIVIAGAGGFIAGSLTRYFRDQGYRRIRAIDKKPLPEWYQRVPGVECLCTDLSKEKNCRREKEEILKALHRYVSILGSEPAWASTVKHTLRHSLRQLEIDR